jgi:hypothetical protein
MTDLNTLVPANSPLYLLFAENINAGGEISGFGVTAGGEIHAVLLTPGSGNTISAGQAGSVKRVLLPENVRKQIAGRLGLGRR